MEFQMRFLVAGAVFAAMAGVAQASPYKEIRDTTVSCTNGLSCDIMLKALTDQPRLYSVNLYRASAVDAPVGLKIRVSDSVRPGSDFVFTVDGAEALRLPVDDLAYDADWSEYAPKDADAGRSLFALLKDAKALTVSFEEAGGGKAETAFSLSGLAGAGLFMDEAQGRLDAKDALVRVGGKVTPTPKARDITMLAELPAALMHDFGTPEAVCGFSDADRFRNGQGFAATVEDGVEMYVLPCAEGGAYNQPFAIYQNLSGVFSPVQLPSMSDEGPTVEGYATNVDWDPETRVLTSFDKGRGLGDCGVLQKWALRNSVGEVSFALKEMRVKDNCDGAEDGGPDSWPLVWPVK